jgi:hypothetical protein
LQPNAASELGVTRPPEGTSARNGHIYLDLTGGDERTRTADPLLAKQGLGNPLTSGFAPSAGHEYDSGEVERRKVRS